MLKVNIYSDNLNVLFKRDKKYNPSVSWADLVVYFRIDGRLVKRCPTILTKEKVIKDYKDLQELFKNNKWTKEEEQEEREWGLCGLDSIKRLKEYKRNMFRFIFDDPESVEIHQDNLCKVPKNEFGYKPYGVELIVTDKDLTVDALKKATKFYLKHCFGIDVKIKQINFIKNISEEEVAVKWKEYCSKKKDDKRMGKVEEKRVVYSGDYVKQLFGPEIRSIIKEKNKTTIVYEDGRVQFEVTPDLKFFKKKRKKGKLLI